MTVAIVHLSGCPFRARHVCIFTKSLPLWWHCLCDVIMLPFIIFRFLLVVANFAVLEFGFLMCCALKIPSFIVVSCPCCGLFFFVAATPFWRHHAVMHPSWVSVDMAVLPFRDSAYLWRNRPWGGMGLALTRLWFSFALVVRPIRRVRICNVEYSCLFRSFLFPWPFLSTVWYLSCSSVSTFDRQI